MTRNVKKSKTIIFLTLSREKCISRCQSWLVRHPLVTDHWSFSLICFTGDPGTLTRLSPLVYENQLKERWHHFRTPKTPKKAQPKRLFLKRTFNCAFDLQALGLRDKAIQTHVVGLFIYYDDISKENLTRHRFFQVQHAQPGFTAFFSKYRTFVANSSWTS